MLVGGRGAPQGKPAAALGAGLSASRGLGCCLCRMEEELAAPSTSADKTDSMDVDGEAKKLLGLGQKHLVLGNIPAAVNAFQEAASILGKKYGETADECAEAFFYYGKSLLELARMENGVLGNALEGVQVEEEEGEKAEDDSMVENADNIDEEAREELREQVYNAMGEKEESKKSAEESPVLNEAGKETEGEDVEMGGKTREEEAIADVETKLKEKAEEQVEADMQEKTVAGEQVAEATEERVEAATEEEAVAEATEERVEAATEEEAVAEATEERVEAATEEEAVAEATEERVEAATEEEAVAEATEERVEAATEEEAVAEATEERVEEATEEEAAAEATEERVEAATEEEAAAEATEERVEAATEEEAAAEATEERVEAATEEEAVAEATEERVEAATEEEAVAEATEERVEAATEEEAVAEAMEEKLNKSKEALASKETLFAAGNATTPAEGKEPANEIETEEKVEVAVKVEKERDDLMEEGDGAKVEKEEEKDDLMEEGEETEGSDEEDKENDKTEDNKENDSTVEDKSFQESEEDEVGNLELAWDMLELAKVIYKRQETKEAQLHAAQAHLKLGEVSIESENYAQAIEEFQACLALQQKYLEAHDRLLAESHYQLALAYHYNSQFDDAILQFRKSVEVIDKRMVMLTERIKKAEGGSTEDEKEIEELNGLLPEIKEKIEDSKESQKSARVAELALKATLVGGATSSFTQSEESCSISTIPVRKPADGASQCVTDISHLVRKKRKPEEETQQGDNEAKKSKPEPAVNGGGDAAPSGNEVAEKMEEETEKRPQVESGAAVESTV
ncbi:nuclear autoantigenic sperm protein isoform X2 [Chelonia mydas]|uniref:nuclear autoantigenic sperm protein isoform X2 n=1 Tax=Chelonia mydas TaxID=8469 RepID=UPI001CA93C77|nr:nuclear autoantigenic sperm protein isoform X2 [Chelonia mydas]